jgi:hypothetical protein
VQISSEIDADLGVISLKRGDPLYWSTASDRFLAYLSSGNRTKNIAKYERREMWESMSAGLRVALTGRHEQGLTAQSISSVWRRTQLSAGDAREPKLFYQYLGKDFTTELVQSKKDFAASEVYGNVYFGIVTRTAAQKEEAEKQFADEIAGGRAYIIDGISNPTFERVRAATSQALRGLMTEEQITRAEVSILLGENVELPSAYMAGVSDLTRIRFFRVLLDVMLAIEMRHDATVEEAAEAAHLVRQHA